jgi:hypothetical protein
VAALAEVGETSKGDKQAGRLCGDSKQDVVDIHSSLAGVGAVSAGTGRWVALLRSAHAQTLLL